ncbi:hypothetical protein L6452_24306 [Arctium lappa]|uniref:Uncharacterized protein n=1 Tax=Arctium lappa TaxID=4217 RepID=A0ACB9ADI6_ARCLA|nr:hypothetical protein L6452_24306 [Arctium lappa]
MVTSGVKAMAAWMGFPKDRQTQSVPRAGLEIHLRHTRTSPDPFKIGAEINQFIDGGLGHGFRSIVFLKVIGIDLAAWLLIRKRILMKFCLRI